ncbi:hypothetical protein CW309_25885 [Pseudomonas hunanensis]|uniref:Uncharacterized protein n=1 Tax=Pseudomonas hunanensis TaxID=1247546 RepID=A0ACC9MXK2_9PSED|nr:hypothetical protein CW309_25885 [Pseudomonas hunanensis]
MVRHRPRWPERARPAGQFPPAIHRCRRIRGHTHRWLSTARRRSGFTRERASPADQCPPAVHRCRRYRIRG